MIFDSTHVTQLVGEWKACGDQELLEDICEETTSLIEVVVSRYPNSHRDDMIQECFMRIPFALGHFNPEIANLHSYFTSVFINRCNSYIEKENREYRITNLLVQSLKPAQVYVQPDIEDESLEMLIVRNRRRFPTIPVDIVDRATRFVYVCIRDGVHGKTRGAIAALMEMFDVKRNVATVLYHSTLVHMRIHYSDGARIIESEDDVEFSLIPELIEVVGQEMYEEILIVFSGLYFKIP
jgi:hypothetical protein